MPDIFEVDRDFWFFGKQDIVFLRDAPIPL